MITKSLLGEALEYRRNGFSIIPSGGGTSGKAPLIPWIEYQKRLPTIEEIKEWEIRFRPRLWGVVTGAVSHIFVPDCDTPLSTSILESAGLNPQVRTPRGGSHFYFKYPGFAIKTIVGILPGIDCRGDGGFVNFIGGRADGDYKILIPLNNANFYLFKQLPIAMRGAITESPQTTNQNRQPIPSSSELPGRLLSRAVAEVGNGNHNRNSTGFWLACQLRDNGLSQLDCEPFLIQYAGQVYNLGNPPYDIEEALASLESAFSQLPRDPISAPTAKDNFNFNSNPGPPGPGRGVIGGRGDGYVQSVTDGNENRIKSVTEGVTETLQGVSNVTGVTNVTNVTGDLIKAYIQESNGAWIEYRDIDSDLGIRTPEQKGLRRVTINRLNNDKVIEKHPTIATRVRLIKQAIEPMNLDFENVQYPLALKLPFGLENKVDLYPRSIAIVAGSKDAGKTAFCFNVARLNHDILPVHYFNSEMGEVEMVKRLRNFDDCMEWKDKVQWIDRAAGFEDVIFPEDINIIDFLEVTQEFYLIGSLLTAIHRKLTTGIAIIAIQKDARAQLGRGNTFGMEKARLYLTLNHLDGVNTARIESGKIWHREGDNPRGQYVNYKLVKGALFTSVTEWRK